MLSCSGVVSRHCFRTFFLLLIDDIMFMFDNVAVKNIC